MTKLTKQELETLSVDELLIASREEAATPGPWRSVEFMTERGLYVGSLGTGDNLLTTYNRTNNADFMAHARDDVPYLLKEVIKLREELAAMRAAMLLAAIV